MIKTTCALLSLAATFGIVAMDDSIKNQEDKPRYLQYAQHNSPKYLPFSQRDVEKFSEMRLEKLVTKHNKSESLHALVRATLQYGLLHGHTLWDDAVKIEWNWEEVDNSYRHSAPMRMLNLPAAVIERAKKEIVKKISHNDGSINQTIDITQKEYDCWLNEKPFPRAVPQGKFAEAKYAKESAVYLYYALTHFKDVTYHAVAHNISSRKGETPSLGLDLQQCVEICFYDENNAGPAKKLFIEETK